MQITAEDFVRTLTGKNHFVTSIAHSAAQQVLGNAVSVYAEHLRLGYGIAEVVCQIFQPDRDGMAGWKA